MTAVSKARIDVEDDVKTSELKAERLRRLIDLEQLVGDIGEAREADAGGLDEEEDAAMAEWLVFEAASHLPGPPVEADLHLVCLPDTTVWDGGEVDVTAMARLVGGVLLEDGRRYILDLGTGSGGWYYECRESPNC